MKYPNVNSRNFFKKRALSNSTAKGALLFAVLFLLFPVAQYAQSGNAGIATPETASPSPTPEEKKSTVRGKAVYDDTDRPVRRAPVILMGISGRKNESGGGLTDNNGNFEIKNLPAGTYFLAISAPGLISPFSFMGDLDGAPEVRWSESVKEFFQEVTVNGKSEAKVNVRAKRGGAISGRITYSDGDPAVNVSISIIRKKDGKLDRIITGLNLLNMFGTRTDDRGVYRIAGLPPGDYYVMASEAAAHDDNNRNSGMDVAFEAMLGNMNSMLKTYYPGETSIQNATLLKITAGQEQSDVDITLSERGLYKISGTVIARRDKRPLKSVRVTLIPRDEKVNSPFGSPAERDMNSSTNTDEEGSWVFRDLPEGTYTIQVSSFTEYEEQPAGPVDETKENYKPPKPKPTLSGKKQEVKLSDADAENITIELSDGATISGKVSLTGNKPLHVPVYITAGRIGTESSDENEETSGRVSTTIYGEGNNEFKLEGLSAGPVYLEATAGYRSASSSGNDAYERYYVKSIRSGSLDLMNSALNITEGGEVKNVEIIFGDDAGTLKGRIRNANEGPAAGALIMLVPTDPSKWRGRASINRFPNDVTNIQGEFQISVPPGEYFIVLTKPNETINVIDNSWLQSKTANAQRIVLTSNENKTASFTLPQ